MMEEMFFKADSTCVADSFSSGFSWPLYLSATRRDAEHSISTTEENTELEWCLKELLSKYRH